MLDKFTFIAYAFRVLKDDPKVFNPFDRYLIHRAMTKGNSVLTKEEEERFEDLQEIAYKALLNKINK